MANKLTELVCQFVEKSGGIEKVKEVADSLREVAKSGDDRITGFLAGIAKNPAGAKELLAAAMLGFNLAAFVYERLRDDSEKGGPK